MSRRTGADLAFVPIRIAADAWLPAAVAVRIEAQPGQAIPPPFGAEATRIPATQVMKYALVSVWNDSGRLDLDQPFGARESGNDDAGRARVNPFQPFADFLIDNVSVPDVRQVDDDPAQMLH